MKNVALITGASSGIGKELARIHAVTGGDRILIARNESKLTELKNELVDRHKERVICIAKDLSKPNAGKEIHDEVEGMGIELDYLINNAGFGGRGKFHEREWEQDLAMIHVNVIALSELTRLFLPQFVKRNRGRVLNVSSTASLMPGPLQAVYYATKAYAAYFSNAIAEELHDTDVTVTNLMPGATETEFAKISGMDKTELFKKPASARSVAEDGYKGMMQGKLDVTSGLTTSQKIMLRAMAFIPKKVVLKQVRQMQEAN